jgi:hypothetical protein
MQLSIQIWMGRRDYLQMSGMEGLCQKGITRGIRTQIPLRFGFGGVLPSGTRFDAYHFTNHAEVE